MAPFFYTYPFEFPFIELLARSLVAVDRAGNITDRSVYMKSKSTIQGFTDWLRRVFLKR